MNVKDYINKYDKKLLKKLKKGEAFIDYDNPKLIEYPYPKFKVGEIITTFEPGLLKSYFVIDIIKNKVIYAEVIVL